MQLNKFSVVILVLLARTNQGEIVVGTPSLNASISRLFEDLGNIVTSCYGDRINGVGLVGKLPDTFIRTLMVQHSIPVALINKTSNIVPGLLDPPVKFRHKLHVFIVESSTFKELWDTIWMNRFFIWWNHMASFFILDFSPGCKHQANMLYMIWRLDVLNAKIICRSTNEETVIITYNPFTSQAPVTWHRLDVLRASTRIKKQNRPFAIFFRKYRENKAICVNLDFDKSKDIGGHEVIIRGYKARPLRADPKDFIDASNLFIKYNRTMTTIIQGLKGKAMAVRDNPCDYCDIHMHAVQMNKDIWQFYLITYPHEQIGFVLVAQFRGHKSQLNKILTVVDVNSRIGIGIVYLITLIFLKFFVHQTLVSAILNIIRITCDTGFTNISDNNATRVFLTGLLFFVVTMQGIYQGNFASLLTTIIPLRDINTMQDVVDFDYKIYVSPEASGLVDHHPDLRERFIPAKTGDCIEHVKNDPLAACLLVAGGIVFDIVRKSRLHMSTEFVARDYAGFHVRWNWPFEHRANMIIQTLVEADAFESWDYKCNPTQLAEFAIDEEVKKNVDFKNIELGELTFAFVILGIGLVCATITYIAEVAIYSYKSRIVNVRVHRLN